MSTELLKDLIYKIDRLEKQVSEMQDEIDLNRQDIEVLRSRL